ncbi:MAG: patatin-like phospholipase family protein [Pirellulaceae bacterium]|nr:patatin-like phospholipase family protein [Pirellulaceae bacterium]
MLEPYSTETVIQEEYLHILSRRANALADLKVDASRQDNPDREALERLAGMRTESHQNEDSRPHERNLIGVALSGGGIRSATFCLGALQSLAELGLLKFCDYISAVSGGGYIASWLAAWIKREGELGNVETQLRRSRHSQAEAKRGFIEYESEVKAGTVRESEPEPLAHIREFSFFLSPRLGIFSADSWSLVAVYLRNLLANLMALVPAMLATVLIVRSVGHLYTKEDPFGSYDWVPLAVSIVSMLVALEFLARGLRLLGVVEERVKVGREQGQKLFFRTLALACLSSVTAAWCCKTNWNVLATKLGVEIGPLPLVIIAAAFFAAIQFGISAIYRTLAHALAASFSIGITVVFAIVLLFGLQYQSVLAAAVPAFGPPSVLLALAVGNMVGMALLGSNANEEEREWRSRLNAWLMIVAFSWSLAAGLAFYSGYLLSLVGSWLTLLVASWATIGAAGVRFAFSAVSAEKGKSAWIRFAVASIVPYVLVVGLLLLLSGIASRLDSVNWDTNKGIPGEPSWVVLLSSLTICVCISFLFSQRVSVNDFSLNAMYANRLTRCFLGASRRKRRDFQLGTAAHCAGPEWNPDPVTGFDFSDDLPLPSLRIGKPATSTDTGYWGPFLLFNTALNVQATERLAWHERKAESFLLSPLFCGAHSLGYRKTVEYAAGQDTSQPISVGRAVAISGAAVNPAMGYYGSPAISALLAVFNIRLAWWLPNPRSFGDPKRGSLPWRTDSPKGLLWWLTKELFSRTDDKSAFLNVSDGGHFDNTGVYELVRRRCRLIISIDAGADPDNTSNELGELIRRCRADFGIDIEIDSRAFEKNRESGFAAAHCVVGTIRYDRLDPTQPIGTLLYIKPSLTGDESHDIKQYARQFPDFPHQSTVDQFYTQAQFESYRALGYHCVQSVLEETVSCISHNGYMNPDLPSPSEATSKILQRVADAHYNVLENLVYSIRSQWLPDSSGSPSNGAALNDVRGHKTVTSEVPLPSNIAEQMDSGLLWDGRVLVERDRSLLHDLKEVRSTLRAMEQAFHQQQLQGTQLQQDNSGWMNLFRRLAATPGLSRCWPFVHFEYSREFVRFCERELSLRVEFDFQEVSREVHVVWRQLVKEFYRCWPNERNTIRGLGRLWRDAVRYLPDRNLPDRYSKALWQLRVRMPESGESDDVSDESFVAGVIGLRKLTWARKLTVAEYRRFISVWKSDNPDTAQQTGGELTSMADAELDDYIRRGVIPSQSELDSRVGYELVVWVRPGFRHRKVGEKLLQEFFHELDQPNSTLRHALSPGGGFRLVVVYPRIGWQSSGERFRAIKRHWLTFFSFYGFRRPGSSWPYADCDEVLVYHGSRDAT